LESVYCNVQFAFLKTSAFLFHFMNVVQECSTTKY
jgi:hypothetical protein